MSWKSGNKGSLSFRSDSNGFDHLYQFVIRCSAVKSHQYVANVGLEGRIGLRVDKSMMYILIQFHDFEEIVFEVFELFPIAFDDFFLRANNIFEFHDSMAVVLKSSVVLVFITFWLMLRFDSFFFKFFLFLYFVDHLSEIFVLLFDVLKRSLRFWVGWQVASGVFCVDDSAIGVGITHRLSI